MDGWMDGTQEQASFSYLAPSSKEQFYDSCIISFFEILQNDGI
jgi:hypothetical protein